MKQKLLQLHKWWTLLLLCFISISGLTQTPYGGKIYLCQDPGKEIQEAAADMAHWLNKATGSTYTLEPSKAVSGSGIFLKLTTDKNANISNNTRHHIGQDGQSFHLLVSSNQVVISATGTNSAINGIYTFLDALGFRWYMPGDNWVIVPKLKKATLKINKIYTPSFRERYYAGSGGVSAVQGLDTDNTFAADFREWNRRNRISSDYPVRGHSGLAFYTANKAELDAHPEYFCDNTVNRTGWIKVDNKSAVDLFVKWAMSQVKPGDKFPLIGVDPADGSGGKGDCLPTNMASVKTWSDKYFWLANQVAAKLDAKDVNTRVQLYAYNQHADVPSFALKKNVYPVIIPYAFQDVSDPDVFIRKWRNRMNGAPMGIYDYWNITQWSKCVPQFNIFNIPDRLKLWKQSKINTVNLETTYSKGAMGHAFWLGFQMMWDVNQSFDKLYNQFLTDCFGPAAADLKKMFNRWSLNYQEALDVAFSYRDLDNAARKTKDPVILSRIREMKAYVRYLELYYDYTQTPDVAKYQTLTNYIRGIHHLRLVHTNALLWYYLPKPKDYKEPDKPTLEAQYRQTVALSPEQIDRNFEQSLRNQPALYDLSSISFDPRKATATPDKTLAGAETMIGNNKYEFWLKKSQVLRFEVGATLETKFTLSDANGKIWVDKMIQPSGTGYEPVSISLPAGKYYLSFGAYYRKSRLKFPADVVFFSEDHNYNNAGYPLLYVYVPKDVSELVYRDQYGPGTNSRGFWISPNGAKVQPTKVKNDIYKIPIPVAERGKVWTLSMGHRAFSLINVPEYYSLNKFKYQE